MSFVLLQCYIWENNIVMTVYLDDLLVNSPDHKTHKKHLKILFTRLLCENYRQTFSTLR